MSHFFYHMYGLNICSELELLGQKKCALTAAVDVMITRTSVSSTGIQNPIESTPFFQANNDYIWINVPTVARFLIKQGQHIFFEPAFDRDENILSSFVYGPCMVALLMQRDLFVLKGAVFQQNDGAIACLGAACSGKSSLMAILAQRGYPILSDDLCVLNKQGEVFPGPSRIELWDDNIELLQGKLPLIDTTRLAQKKHCFSTADSAVEHSVSLSKIYILNQSQRDTLKYEMIHGAQKISELQKNVYNRFYLNALGKSHLYFSYVGHFAQHYEMRSIQFNRGQYSTFEIANDLQGAI